MKAFRAFPRRQSTIMVCKCDKCLDGCVCRSATNQKSDTPFVDHLSGIKTEELMTMPVSRCFDLRSRSSSTVGGTSATEKGSLLVVVAISLQLSYLLTAAHHGVANI